MGAAGCRRPQTPTLRCRPATAPYPPPLFVQFDRVWYYYIQNGTISEPYTDFLVDAPVSEVLQFLEVGALVHMGESTDCSGLC